MKQKRMEGGCIIWGYLCLHVRMARGRRGAVWSRRAVLFVRLADLYALQACPQRRTPHSSSANVWPIPRAGGVNSLRPSISSLWRTRCCRKRPGPTVTPHIPFRQTTSYFVIQLGSLSGLPVHAIWQPSRLEKSLISSQQRRGAAVQNSSR